MSYLVDIKRHTGPNTAGIVELLVARKDSVLSIPSAIDGIIYESIVFKEGFGFVTWHTTSQSIGMKSQHRTGEEGGYKRSGLPFSLAKDSPGVVQQLERAVDDEFIVLYRDANGLLKLFGTLESPVLFKYDYNTGRAHRSKNGYQCEFYYEGTDNISFFQGDVPQVPVVLAPVVIEWNDGETIQTIAVVQPGDVVRINSRFAYTDFEINPTVL